MLTNLLLTRFNLQRRICKWTFVCKIRIELIDYENPSVTFRYIKRVIVTETTITLFFIVFPDKNFAGFYLLAFS